MGRNIFVSYKYADAGVEPINGEITSTARSYVNSLAEIRNKNGHAYYGEKDDEDLSYLDDDQIYEKLKDRIFPTSCTIVLISPNMKESGVSERNQWIPWEVYYSLRETTRADHTSRRNAILAVVLPDSSGKYDYAIERKQCCYQSCTEYHISGLFSILKKNMFNLKNPQNYYCSQQNTIWKVDSSYIPMVRWIDFLKNVNYYVEKAESIKDRSNEFDLHIKVD